MTDQTSSSLPLYDEFGERGFVAAFSQNELWETLDKRPLGVYAGFDPSADSLHLGHLVPVMALSHLQARGHRVIVLVGGATGMVGDPSGRSSERNLLDAGAVKKNADALREQLSSFLRFSGENAAIMVDNNDWIGSMSFIDWLREVGKHFTINYMLGKESVRRRLSTESGEGLSFTEFAYMTMQAFDFLYLNDHYQCELQIGGNDQWGNITAGMDLIRKVRGRSVFALTLPLVATASGEKFGKSAGNAVWLDPQRTSPFEFYQYWMQTDDRDLDRFMKLFTFMGLEEIRRHCQKHFEAPELHRGQRVLADKVTSLVHGQKGLESAQSATEVLFGGGELKGLNERELVACFAHAPSIEIEQGKVVGVTALDAVLAIGFCASKGDARRRISEGGIYLNNNRVADPAQRVKSEDLLFGKYLVFRSGRKNHTIVRAL